LYIIDNETINLYKKNSAFFMKNKFSISAKFRKCYINQPVKVQL